MAIRERDRKRYTVGINPKLTDRLIAEKIRRLEIAAKRDMPRIVRETNKEGLAWIQHMALEILIRKMALNRRPDFVTGALENAILSEKYSTADGRGIKFLIDRKIRHDVPYYAALEYGDRSQVGRYRYFWFLGTGHSPLSVNRPGAAQSEYIHQQAPDYRRGNSTGRQKDDRGLRARTPKLFKTDRIIGKREHDRTGVGGSLKDRHRTLILRPVPQYRYGRGAGQAFATQGIYETILDQHIRSSGLPDYKIRFVMHR